MTLLEQYALVSRKSASLMRYAPVLLSTMLVGMLSACGGSANIPAATSAAPTVYMSPTVAGISSTSENRPASSVATYSINHAEGTFAQATYSSQGTQLHYSGTINAAQRGLLNLGLLYNSCPQTSGCASVTYPAPQLGGGWLFELSDHGGGLAQFSGQPFVPLVAAASCPAMTSAETFLFVTLPDQLNAGSLQLGEWNPQTETAYGSVDISASGTSITLNNISQYILPSSGGGAPSNPSATSVIGACSSTLYGNTVTIPAQLSITNPGNGQAVTPQALLGIGPSGLLVEDNGDGATGSAAPPYYQNALGAGTGAVGLPKPSSAVDTSALAGAQYLGFFYGGGQPPYTANWSSAPVSFGFPSLPSNCPSIAPQTSTMLYGGDFPGNDPAGSATGYGNCDFAVDLGAQDAATNGLYPAATVYVGSGFGSNTTGKTYSFPAVAIAGQVNGKYAIFLIGVDSVGSPNQAWGVYLLQSN